MQIVVDKTELEKVIQKLRSTESSLIEFLGNNSERNRLIDPIIMARYDIEVLVANAPKNEFAEQ